jgi:uncharacterized protein (DUF488 family)
MELYTIGHSRHPSDKFIQLLIDHRIETLVDVRSTPSSRFNHQFNKNALQQTLEGQHIEYMYAGDELGGRPKDPTCYKHQAIPSKRSDYLDELDYAEVMKRPWFIQGIRKLLELAGQHTSAILCSEEDPAKCHRHQLIARYLFGKFPEVTILHIRADGSLLDAKSMPGSVDHADNEQFAL